MKKATLFYEWVSLPKEEFRILVMLADQGDFKGNLSDVCRYFSMNARQAKTKRCLQNSIAQLTTKGFITSQLTGYTYTLTAISQNEPVTISRELMLRIKNHDYSSEDVAWEQVLKLLLWVTHHPSSDITTNMAIASDLNVSVSTLTCAKNVLRNDFDAIAVKNAYKKLPDGSINFSHCIGHFVEAGAWWEPPTQK